MIKTRFTEVQALLLAAAIMLIFATGFANAEVVSNELIASIVAGDVSALDDYLSENGDLSDVKYQDYGGLANIGEVPLAFTITHYQGASAEFDELDFKTPDGDEISRAKTRNDRILPFLFEHGMDPNVKVDMGGERLSPIGYLGYSLYISIAMMGGYDSESARRVGEMALHVIDHYADYGGIIDTDSSSFMALLGAYATESPALFSRMIELGADPLAESSSGNAARFYFQYAMQKGYMTAGILTSLLDYPGVVEFLMNEDPVSDDGPTPFGLIVLAGQNAAVEKFVEDGVDLDTSHWPSRDWTALHIAAAGGHADTVEYMLSLGAKPEPLHEGGPSPLHVVNEALSGDAAKIVEFLITAGADMDTRNSEGKTPLEKALSEDNDELVQALRASGAEE